MTSKYTGFLKVLLTLSAQSLLLMKQCQTNPLFMIMYWSMMYAQNCLQDFYTELEPQPLDVPPVLPEVGGKVFTLISNTLWVMHVIVCKFCTVIRLDTSNVKCFKIKSVSKDDRKRTETSFRCPTQCPSTSLLHFDV